MAFALSINPDAITQRMKLMHKAPVIAFSAWSGTGKTTIIEKLIVELKKRGLKVAAVKHDAHDFEIDKEGKDSWRFTKAGADVTVISSAAKTAMISLQAMEPDQIMGMLSGVDIILAEGFSNENLPCIGICRKETGRGLRRPVCDHIALITDEPVEDIPDCIPVFGFDETVPLADFLVQFIKTGTITN